LTDEQHAVDLLPELALGVLPEDEADTLRQHLAGCESCRAEFEEMERVARLLPLAAADVSPSPAVKEGLLERIEHEPRPLVPRETAHRPRWWIGAVAAAVAALVVIGGIGGYLLRGDSDTAGQDAGRDAQLLASVAQGSAATAKAGSGGLQLSFLRSPGAAEGFAWVQSFPALPEGKAYQAWFTKDGTTFEPGEVFSTENGGVWLKASSDLGDYAAMAFTIEDSAGVKEPTQAPFVVVPLSGAAMNITIKGK
jgi:predicted anti-sigma-YlaC factor YlaD